MRLLTYRQREKLIHHADTYIGVTEEPPGSNRGHYVDAWQRRTNGIVGYPWCAAFAYCMCLDVGCDLAGLDNPAAVLSWVEWARRTGRLKGRPSGGGMLVAYSWSGATPTPGDHIGIIEKVLSFPLPRGWTMCRIRTVEGNTGDGVYRRWRWVRRSTVAFIQV